jgi:hypothetical protein
MTDAPFTETHRATLRTWLSLGDSTPALPSFDAAIVAALAEIDRLTAENRELWAERQARIFPEQLRQAEAARRKT